MVELTCELVCACLVAALTASAFVASCKGPGYPDGTLGLGLERIPDTTTMTKWFYPTRLETRTKESNMCASSRVVKLACAMKVTAGIFAPATDQSIERGLSMSIPVRTRKMVNYA